MIAAMTRERVIGNEGGGIPWSGKLPRDQQHFRGYTQGKWMLLGRKTYEEMVGWFTDQVPVVLTGDASYDVENGHRVGSVEDAVELARLSGADELVVSGGASVYEAALLFADTLQLTVVEAEMKGGRFFPEWEAEAWETIREERFEADSENAFGMVFKILRRL